MTASKLGAELDGPFDRGRGGPGGWWILDEPERSRCSCSRSMVGSGPRVGTMRLTADRRNLNPVKSE
jgi:hypothetical protein